MGLLNFIINAFSQTEKQSKTYINDNGYFCFKDSNKPVHQWVAEKKLGRKLRSGEVVHHRNRNKLDNSPENLQIFPNQKAHDEQHEKDARNHGWEYSYMGKNKKITLYYLFKGMWE